MQQMPLFQSVFMILESNHVGTFVPSVRVDPLRLYRYAEKGAIVLLISEVGGKRVL